ncbi:hypothetical protein ACEZDB_36255 [Streptacidiphilus sp. N1-3]|uniref:Uncharacterized protein n=1 Tax=Streptacidiphilus alkalitolerans TaxID=3342712 RepID=A0ABV6XDP8_9ACTN
MSEYVDEYTSGDRQALADGLGFLTSQANLKVLLGGVLEDPVLLRRVVGQSVWHPNGFAKIVLLSQHNYRLRLHFWNRPPGWPVALQENIHNHRWDFCTVILAGRYRHQEFRASAGGVKFFSYQYRKDSIDPGSYLLVPTGTGGLECAFDALLPSGTRYTMSSEVLHRVIRDSCAPAVSLVLEGPHQDREVQVFSRDSLILDAGPSRFGRISSGSVVGCIRETLHLHSSE